MRGRSAATWRGARAVPSLPPGEAALVTLGRRRAIRMRLRGRGRRLLLRADVQARQRAERSSRLRAFLDDDDGLPAVDRDGDLTIARNEYVGHAIDDRGDVYSAD